MASYQVLVVFVIGLYACKADARPDIMSVLSKSRSKPSSVRAQAVSLPSRQPDRRYIDIRPVPIAHHWNEHRLRFDCLTP